MYKSRAKPGRSVMEINRGKIWEAIRDGLPYLREYFAKMLYPDSHEVEQAAMDKIARDLSERIVNHLSQPLLK